MKDVRTYQPVEVGTLWARPMPLRTGPGLQWRGGASGGGLALVNPQVSFARMETASPSAGASFGHNWKAKAVDATHLTISPSYCAGGVATIGGVGLDDATPPQLEVSATDLVYVYLCVEWSLSTTVEDHVEPSSTVVSREITAETGLKTDTTTSRYFLLFQWQAGRVVAQSRWWNFEMDLIDNGLATGTPIYRTWPSA